MVCLHEEVYKPSDDTYIMLEYIESNPRFRGSFVIEIGCGSGILTAALVRAGAREVVAVDVNDLACECTVCTLTSNFGEKPVNTHVIRGDLTSPLRRGVRVDYIVFNPPYLPCTPKDRQSLAWCGGEDGVEVVCRLVDELLKYNISFGKLILILSSRSNINRVLERLKGLFNVKFSVKARFFFEQLILVEVSR